MTTQSTDTSKLPQARLTKGSIPGHLVGQTLPAIVGGLAMMSIGLVDSYFIGQLGPDALAAIAFIFPVLIALTSLGVGVMVGINSVVARALGEGDGERAHRKANFGIVFAAGIGIIMGMALYAGQGALFTLMNAPAHLMPLISAYMEPYAIGLPLILMIMGFNGVLRAQGEARKTSIVSVTYASANWVLDPILIVGVFGFEGFGIAGAAYASIAGYAIGAVLSVFMISRTDLPIDLGKLKGANVGEPAKAILRVGLPASFSNAINPMGLMVLTALIALESEAAVAAFGAAGRVQSFALVPLLSLSGTIGAIVGQNWGARAFDRSREAALFAFGFCLFWGLGIAIVMAFSGAWFGRAFSDEAEVIAQFARYFQIAAWGYAGFGVLIVANGILNAVDKASFALSQSAARVFLVMLPFAWIFLPEWGSEAIFGAELAANVFGGISGAALAFWILSRRAPDRCPSPA